jgi:hypothetical protein
MSYAFTSTADEPQMAQITQILTAALRTVDSWGWQTGARSMAVSICVICVICGSKSRCC